MPPKLDPLKAHRMDGDINRVRDYDLRENQPGGKKKHTHFYTKEEMELQKARSNIP